MARGKHTTALFEVIHSDKRFKQGHGSEPKDVLKTPKWWFRGRGGKAETPAETSLTEMEGDPTTSATARAMLSRGSTAVAVQEPPPPAPAPHNRLAELTAPDEPPAPPPQTPPAAVPPPVEERVPTPPVEPPTESPPRGRAIFSTVRYESADYDEPSPADPTRPRGYLGRWGMQCTLHPDDRFLTLRLRYSAAAILAGVMLLALVLAYVVGRSAGRSSTTTTLAPNSTAALQAGPTHPDVLDVAPTAPQRKAAEATRTSRSTESQQNLVAPPSQSQVVGTDPPQAHDLPRQVNLNYVIIQSYPDRADAQEASALLIRNGVDCTIERALPRYSANQDWYVVVGTTGFAKVRSADFEAYIAKIKQIGAQGAAGKRTFKSFQPMGYKWMRPDRG